MTALLPKAVIRLIPVEMATHTGHVRSREVPCIKCQTIRSVKESFYE